MQIHMICNIYPYAEEKNAKLKDLIKFNVYSVAPISAAAMWQKVA